MSYPTSLKLVALKHGVEVLCEVLHPMEPGSSGVSNSVTQVSQGNQVVTNYITQVVFRLNGRVKAEFFLGKSISRHPVIGTVFSQVNAGDQVNVSWQDLSGNSGQATATIK